MKKWGIILLFTPLLAYAAEHSGWSDYFNLRNLTGPIALQERAANPSGITGFTVSPNPFNRVGVLTFKISGKAIDVSGVMIKIYDLKGREVVALPLALFNGGQAAWNGQGRGGLKLASGIYLARLKLGAKFYEHKFLLVR